MKELTHTLKKKNEINYLLWMIGKNSIIFTGRYWYKESNKAVLVKMCTTWSFTEIDSIAVKETTECWKV